MIKSFIHPHKIKIALISILCICTLIILVPFLITKLIPDKCSDKSGSPTNYEQVQVPNSIMIYRTVSNKAEKYPFEEYVKGVVSCEMPSTFHSEALKAQAVAARTYSVAKVINAKMAGNPTAHPAAPICDSTHCQVFKNEEELRNIKGEEWMKDDYIKICKAIDDTKGQLLYYNGELVQQALFHSSSGGATENCEDVFTAAVPYLVSVESPYEDEATHQDEKTEFSIYEFASKIQSSYPNIYFGQITPTNIKIVSRSEGNRVDKIDIGSSSLTGRQIREALGLSSANFTIEVTENTITFTTNGSGHGVGMSQYGANGMAKEGYNYKKILSHYYSGTEVY